MKAYKKSLIFSICYVGLATLALFSMYPGSLFHGDWTIYVLFITLPVSVFSFGCIYSAGESATLIVIAIQTVMFLLTWYVSYRIMKLKKIDISNPVDIP